MTVETKTSKKELVTYNGKNIIIYLENKQLARIDLAKNNCGSCKFGSYVEVIKIDENNHDFRIHRCFKHCDRTDAIQCTKKKIIFDTDFLNNFYCGDYKEIGEDND